MTTKVNASRTYAATLAKGGVMESLFTGRKIKALAGPAEYFPYWGPAYRPSFAGSVSSVRPGAYSPRTSRVSMRGLAPSAVGTTMVIGGLDEIRERNATRGAAGSRSLYGSHAPRRAGLGDDRRVSLRNTPAYPVLETAFARTSIPVLYSKFAAPAGMTPNGMDRFDPIPAYTHVPLGALVESPSPVGCLPGTPGCYRGGDPGRRKHWWQTQNEGNGPTSMPSWMSPLPPAPDEGGYVSDPGDGAIMLPISSPGTQHSAEADGSPSYAKSLGYPSYSSPFGHAGSDRPSAAPPPMPSGHDAPWRKIASQQARGRSYVKAFALGAAILAGFKIFGRVR